MRRRSERRKSTEVSSPAPVVASRRTSRRLKSPSISEDDKAVEQKNEVPEKHISDAEEHRSAEENTRDSSEERTENRKGRRRSRSIRTPVKEQKTSPAKRRNLREASPDVNIPAIQEEEEASAAATTEVANEAPAASESKEVKAGGEKPCESPERQEPNATVSEAVAISDPKENETVEIQIEKKEVEGKSKSDSQTVEQNQASDEEESRSSSKTEKENGSTEDPDDKEDQDEVKLYTRDNSPRSRSNSSERKQPSSNASMKVDEDENEAAVVQSDRASEEPNDSGNKIASEMIKSSDQQSKLEEVNHNQDGKTNETSNTTAAANTGRDISNNTVSPNNNNNSSTTTVQRKRRWLTKKVTDCNKEPILAISTDSLKTLIADVHPVPLSDVQLESSSDVEDVTSEREEGEQSPTPEPTERRRTSIEKVEITLKRQQSKESVRQVAQVVGVSTAAGPPIQRLPSPARNESSCVLFITNLVRPFTVLQLKGLLARTGKIVENGFWIDRIKSKCFVEYETEDEAIETRHALHGVRWPASNPKCLNVDFGNKDDMLKAIETTKEEAPKFGQETNKDNVLIGTGWNRDRNEEDKRAPRPVREWDVGKKENLERDLKAIKDMERRRERSRERERGGSKNRDNVRNERDRNDRERNDRDRERRRRDRENRSSSLSPSRKLKKKDDPPLRLLDDLFRKTKGTPCIYWLPLTPELIAEKEAMRQKRIEEQKQRIKQREMERDKDRERDRERVRQNDRERERERDHRRPRSNDRRRSRSRDRRRY